MGFHENAEFPESLSYGSSGGPGFKTDIITSKSRAEVRFARWNGAKHTYNVARSIQTPQDYNEVKTFYMARKGSAYGFKYYDILDHTSAVDGVSDPTDTDVEIGEGDNSVTQFQLIKKYTDAGVTRTRNIEKPIDGTVVIAINGTPQASGWSVSLSTGIVTFATAPTLGQVITAGFEFKVPARFSKDADDILNGSYDNFDDINSIIGIEELPSPLPINDEYDPGGSKEHGEIDADTDIVMSEGLVQTAEPTTSGLALRLPDETNLPYGFLFALKNISVTYTLGIKNYSGGSEGTIGTNSVVLVFFVTSGLWLVV